MFAHELSRLDSGLLYCLFGVPDRIQHLFWRSREPDHPANRDRPIDPRFAPVIPDAYRRCDAAVGHALEAADDRTLVIALSDHGFTSFRRGVNVNSWLHEHNFLSLAPDARLGDPPDPLLRHVDWSRTRAYALGLAGIYLNLQGREGQGTVPPDEAEGLGRVIAAGLSGLVDPEDGVPGIRSVVPREHIYKGPYVGEAPDLLVFYAAGYRASWGSAIGGVGRSAFEDNTRAWSGDHIVDPALVPGILLMNRPFRADGASLADLRERSSTPSACRQGPTWKGVRCCDEDHRHRDRRGRPGPAAER